MAKLILRPEQRGYSMNPGVNFTESELDGGGFRRRVDFHNVFPEVEVQWLFDAWQNNYFWGFYRLHTNRGVDPFEIDLIVDNSSLCEYTAWFTKEGQPRIVAVRGLTYTVRATLRLRPTNVEDDELSLFLYEQYAADGCKNLDAELAKLWECLDRIANESFL